MTDGTVFVNAWKQLEPHVMLGLTVRLGPVPVGLDVADVPTVGEGLALAVELGPDPSPSDAPE